MERRELSFKKLIMMKNPMTSVKNMIVKMRKIRKKKMMMKVPPLHSLNVI